MFRLQNFLLAIIITNAALTKSTFGHILRSMRYQLVVLHDISLFEKESTKCISLSWWRVIRLTLGYMAYVTPIIILGLTFSFVEFNVTLCRPLKVEFLLDNTAKLARNVSWSTLYTLRKDLDDPKDPKDPFYNDGGLLWDAHGYTKRERIVDIRKLTEGYRFGKHWPLNSIDDLLNQYNYAGYHDICNYPVSHSSVSSIVNLDLPTSKGLSYVYPGYVQENSSGFEFNYE